MANYRNTSDLCDHVLPESALALSGISSCLSIVGAIIIFMTYKVNLHSDVIQQTRRLLMFLTIADVMMACGILGGTVRYAVIYHTGQWINMSNYKKLCRHPDEVCVAQSMVTTYAGMASFFWTMVIGIHLVRQTVTSIDISDATRPWNETPAHILCWGVPACITMAAIYKNVLGENFSLGTGPWCWIKACQKKEYLYFWMAMAGKGWDVFTYTVTMVFYVFLLFCLKRKGWTRAEIPQRSHYRLRKEDGNFVYLWLITYVLKMWGTVRFLYDLSFKPSYKFGPRPDSDYYLLHLQSFCDGFQAFCNCVVFVFFDKTIRNGIIQQYRCQREETNRVNSIRMYGSIDQ